MGNFYTPPTEKELEIAKEACERLIKLYWGSEIEANGFSYVDDGSDKIVYIYKELPGWVIKKGNKSCLYEAKNYEAAVKVGLERFFAPSFFIMSEERNEGNLVVEYYFTIQREVECDYDNNLNSIDNYIAENYYTDEDWRNIENGVVDESEVLSSYEEDCDDIDNVRALIGFSTDEEEDEFRDFCDKVQLNDIHAGNFGLCIEEGQMVIVDYSGWHNWKTFEQIQIA